MIRKNRAWLAVLVWMIVIFVFSAMPADESSEQSGRVVAWILAAAGRLFGEHAVQILLSGPLEFVVRKCAHFTEYAVLAILLCHAMRLSGCSNGVPLAILISAAYAATDEFHQFFVPGRSMELRDVFVDTCGAAFGTAVRGLFYFLGRKKNLERDEQRDA